MVDANQLKELRRLTNAGLTECKNALEAAGGDLFKAAIAMLSEEDALKIKQSTHVRAMAGQSIKDPVTDDEQKFVDALVSHFIAQRTRPLNTEFMYELTRFFHVDATVREAFMKEPASAVRRVWQLMNNSDDTQTPPTAETCEARQCISTVVTMPATQSEWECDFIVLQHPRRRFFRSTPTKVFAIYKRTKMDDRGLLTIAEMAIQKAEVVSARRWVLTDASLQPRELAQIGFAPQLQELT